LSKLQSGTKNASKNASRSPLGKSDSVWHRDLKAKAGEGQMGILMVNRRLQAISADADSLELTRTGYSFDTFRAAIDQVTRLNSPMALKTQSNPSNNQTKCIRFSGRFPENAVDLAIEDHHVPGHRVHHGLGTRRREVEDGEPSVGQ
jgi:hypothetical protein